jgi:hypothetical protein
MPMALLLLAGARGSAAAAPSGDELSIKLEQQPWTGDLHGMIERRVIRVLVPYSRTLYFVELGGTPRGMSYDFMRAFEDDFNRKLGRGDLRPGAGQGGREPGEAALRRSVALNVCRRAALSRRPERQNCDRRSGTESRT